VLLDVNESLFALQPIADRMTEVASCPLLPP
jgi:hypothetical protein